MVPSESYSLAKILSSRKELSHLVTTLITKNQDPQRQEEKAGAIFVQSSEDRRSGNRTKSGTFSESGDDNVKSILKCGVLKNSNFSLPIFFILTREGKR